MGELDRLLGSVTALLRPYLTTSGPSGALDPDSPLLRQLRLQPLPDHAGSQELLMLKSEPGSDVPVSRLRYEAQDIGPAYVRRVGDNHVLLLARRVLAELPDRAQWRYVLPMLHDAWEINSMLRRVLAADAEPTSEWTVPPPGATLVGALRVEGDRAAASGVAVPARYADGYRSGLTSARSLVDQRISALIAAGDDRTPMTPTSDFRGDWSLFAYEQRTEPAAWALECVPAYNARRPSAAWTPAQRVLDVLVPVGGRSRAATRLADLLVGRLPVLGQDHAVLVAQLADARRRYDLMSGRLRVLWDDLGLTRDALYWRAELASQLLVAAATISAGIGGVADDFLAGFNSGSNRVVRYLTARAAEVGVPHELL